MEKGENKLGIKKILSDEENFLLVERMWIFLVLIFIGGYLGAFTYFLRGRVFSNAQTGNMVLLAIAIGEGNKKGICYTLISLATYFAGTMLTEYFSTTLNKIRIIKWETISVLIEVIVTLGLGFLPETAPYEISQLAVNVIAAMQFATFRKAQGIGMSTAFCTNHVREAGVNIVRYIRERQKVRFIEVSISHLLMIIAFIIGATISVLLGKIFLGKSIWFISGVLFVLFLILLRDDILALKKTNKKVE